MPETFQILLPQSILAIFACLFILGGVLPVSPRRWGPLALVALFVTAASLHHSAEIQGSAGLAVRQTTISVGIEWTCLILGALFVLISMEAQAQSKTAAEFYGLFLLFITGILLVATANDLILMFLALELISIPTYILLYLGRKDYASQEAAIKYFLLSILSAAVLLYGFAMLYGLTGSTRMDAITQVLKETYGASSDGMPTAGGSSLGIIALVLIFAGLSFKIAAVPFPFYAPDVYEGTSAFNAGLLAVGPKIAGFVALIRVVSESFYGFESTGQQLALILAAITMTGGNCLALLQTNIRRLLAYSSIAHAGYMLIGIAVAFWEHWNPRLSLDAAASKGYFGLPGGNEATLLYLLAYSLTSVGLFGALVYLGRPGKQVDHVDELTGLGKTHPLVASVIALFLFSLAGIPPLPGFWAKLSVFAAALSVRQDVGDGVFALHPAFLCLAVIGVLNAAIGGVYYLRVIAVMFLNDPIGSARPAGGRPAYVGVLASAVLVAALGLFPRTVFEFLQRDRTPIVAPAAAALLPAGAAVADAERGN